MSSEAKSDRHCINCELIRETHSAWLINDGEKEHWLPKSQCELDSRADGTWDAFVPQWLAKTKGMDV